MHSGVMEGPPHDRQHRQIHPDGQQCQFRQHSQHGAGRADSALPPAVANPGAVDEPDLRFAQTGLPLDDVDPEAIERPIHWEIGVIERFMIVMGPISTVFDVITFAVLLQLFHSGEAFFRTGWFIKSLVTQILMIFAVRTRRHIFASRPHRAVVGLAFGTAGVALALPFLPAIGHWFEFVYLPASYFAFLVAVVAAFLVMTELVKRAFYARIAPAGD